MVKTQEEMGTPRGVSGGQICPLSHSGLQNCETRALPALSHPVVLPRTVTPGKQSLATQGSAQVVCGHRQWTLDPSGCQLQAFMSRSQGHSYEGFWEGSALCVERGTTLSMQPSVGAGLDSLEEAPEGPRGSTGQIWASYKG